MTSEEEVALLERINALLKPLNCVATELGPDSVGVQGDARAYGPCVYVTFPQGMDHTEIARISNEITNTIRGLTRVMMNVAGH